NLLIHKNKALFLSTESLLYEDYPEQKFSGSLEIENIIYLSKHSSSKDISSLTVHPMGNFETAVLGGQMGKLSLASPELMCDTLRRIREQYKGEKFSVTLEATHHGPLSNVPGFFAEIGTTEKDWKDQDALKAVS
ncbi:D-aminoacyl-tRNA deacylase, partial [mine drainage metagenome]